MPRRSAKRTLVHVGIKHSVVALDAETGEEVWRTKLKGYTFAGVFRDGDALYATASGEVFRLDPETGAVLWNAPLKGLGTGLAVLVGPATAPEQQRGAYVSTAQQIASQQAAAGAAGGGAT